MIRRGAAGGVDGHRVAGGVLVDVGGAVADPLPPAVHRHAHVQLDLAHFERGGVPVAQQVADQGAVLADPLRAGAVGDPRRLHDGGVAAHVVHHPHVAVVEHRQRLPQNRLQLRRRRAGGWRRPARARSSSRCRGHRGRTPGAAGPCAGAPVPARAAGAPPTARDARPPGSPFTHPRRAPAPAADARPDDGYRSRNRSHCSPRAAPTREFPPCGRRIGEALDRLPHRGPTVPRHASSANSSSPCCRRRAITAVW